MMNNLNDVAKHFDKLNKQEKLQLLSRVIFHTTITLRVKYEKENFIEIAKDLNEFTHIISNYLSNINSDKNYSSVTFIENLIGSAHRYTNEKDLALKIIYDAFNDIQST